MANPPAWDGTACSERMRRRRGKHPSHVTSLLEEGSGFASQPSRVRVSAGHVSAASRPNAPLAPFCLIAADCLTSALASSTFPALSTCAAIPAKRATAIAAAAASGGKKQSNDKGFVKPPAVGGASAAAWIPYGTAKLPIRLCRSQRSSQLSLRLILERRSS